MVKFWICGFYPVTAEKLKGQYFVASEQMIEALQKKLE